MDTKSTSHCRYNINYHLVWCSKYRHKVLIGEIEAFLKGVISAVCQNYGYELLNLEVMPDHLHLFIPLENTPWLATGLYHILLTRGLIPRVSSLTGFISAPPIIAPIEIVKTIKSITAIGIFKRFPGLKSKKFWNSGLWSKGYYVGTAGTVTAETIQRYIDEQKTRS